MILWVMLYCVVIILCAVGNMQLILISVAILVCSAADGARLIKAPANEIISNSYLVHVKPSTPMSQLRRMVNKLHKVDKAVSNCTAKVSCVLNKAAYGFTANLSSDVLQKVNTSIMVVELCNIWKSNFVHNITCI